MDIKDISKKCVMDTYARFDSVIMRGNSATAYDNHDKVIIDFGSGIGVNSLGYADEDWAAAVSRQAKKMQHCSNLFYNEPSTMLAEDLIRLTGYDKVLFCNSGAEANEAALKLARKYSFDKYGSGRNKVISLKNSFHGRTIATLSLTGQDSFHNYYHPFVGEHYYSDVTTDSFESLIDDKCAAVFIELVQGEGGVNQLDKEFVLNVSDTCLERDILLVVDEVQTGIGRTGTLFAYEQYGIKPDIVTMAKGLGGGLPIGAILANKKCGGVFSLGDHGTTFGGNPVVAAGARVVLKKVAATDFLKSVQAKGFIIRDMLKRVKAIKSISGMGLMLGLELREGLKSREIAERCLENGLIVLTAKSKLRLLPPLNITESELIRGLNILVSVLNLYC